MKDYEERRAKPSTERLIQAVLSDRPLAPKNHRCRPQPGQCRQTDQTAMQTANKGKKEEHPSAVNLTTSPVPLNRLNVSAIARR
jgi:hypothetical protein